MSNNNNRFRWAQNFNLVSSANRVRNEDFLKGTAGVMQQKGFPCGFLATASACLEGVVWLLATQAGPDFLICSLVV